MDERMAGAQRVVPVFEGDRLRALRELAGGTQAALAKAAGITPSALSQAERGQSNPTAQTLLRLADALEVPVESFARRPEPKTELNPQFRHLRRTPQREQKRALRLVEATDQVLGVLSSRVDLPNAFSLEYEIDPAMDLSTAGVGVEVAAQQTRIFLGLHPTEPIDPTVSGLVELLESNGVVLVRDPETDENIDAYSAVVNGQPIVILDGAQTDWDRDNFNVAHELGHIVMHRESSHRPGIKTAEAQAHRFAGALLIPREAMESEMPPRLDWAEYLELKLKWGMSMAALVHRAHDLGLMDDATYTRAMKQRSAHGWRRREPGREARPLARPSLLAEAARTAGLSAEEIASSVGIPVSVVARILGPGPKPKVRV